MALISGFALTGAAATHGPGHKLYGRKSFKMTFLSCRTVNVCVTLLADESYAASALRGSGYMHSARTVAVRTHEAVTVFQRLTGRNTQTNMCFFVQPVATIVDGPHKKPRPVSGPPSRVPIPDPCSRFDPMLHHRAMESTWGVAQNPGFDHCNPL
jgi:hypothetical protein